MRGLQPIFMDSLVDHTEIVAVGRSGSPGDTSFYPARTAMSQTASYAARLDLRYAVPNGALTSTAFMLAAPGSQYLVLAYEAAFTVNLSAGAGSTFDAEWFNVSTGATTVIADVTGGSSSHGFTPPFGGFAVLFLNKVV
jgi:hypothetical protein